MTIGSSELFNLILKTEGMVFENKWLKSHDSSGTSPSHNGHVRVRVQIRSLLPRLLKSSLSHRNCDSRRTRVRVLDSSHSTLLIGNLPRTVSGLPLCLSLACCINISAFSSTAGHTYFCWIALCVLEWMLAKFMKRNMRWTFKKLFPERNSAADSCRSPIWERWKVSCPQNLGKPVKYKFVDVHAWILFF